MATNTTSRPKLRTKTLSLLLAFLTALASLGMLTSTTQAADAAPGDFQYIPSYNWWDRADFDWTWILNEAPEFNDYLVCFNGHIYADFVDPDGEDNEMTVELKVHRGSLTYTYMMDMSDGYHGVFWWKNMALTHSTPPHLIDSISLRAQDANGAWSETITSNYDHTNWDQCA